MPSDKRNTFIIHLLDNAGGFAEASLVVLLIIEEDHEEINVIGRIPLLEGDVCFLLDLSDWIEATNR